MRNLRYTRTHEWVEVDTEDKQIGITMHAQDLLGDMVYVELPEVGQEVVAGAEIGVLESVKAASDLYAPISGTIVAINTDVIANPGLVNTEPTGCGWLVKISPQDNVKFAEEIKQLLSEDEYLGTTAEES